MSFGPGQPTFNFRSFCVWYSGMKNVKNLSTSSFCTRVGNTLNGPIKTKINFFIRLWNLFFVQILGEDQNKILTTFNWLWISQGCGSLTLLGFRLSSTLKPFRPLKSGGHSKFFEPGYSIPRCLLFCTALVLIISWFLGNLISLV